MSALANFADRHPVSTGLIGTATTAGSWFMQNLAALNEIARFIAAALSIVIGLLTIAVLIRRLLSKPRLRFTLPDPDDDIEY
jgi:hypothetical protein